MAQADSHSEGFSSESDAFTAEYLPANEENLSKDEETHVPGIREESMKKRKRHSLGRLETQQPVEPPAAVSISPSSEHETCRICRCEGTAEEELYYPCKCSGSIRYVHQDCLKQWLAHSQKRHCELCKTPFRFTKLYASEMPDSVPVYTFLTYATIHSARGFLHLLRVVTVAVTWILLVPWVLRFVWHFLFFVGDWSWAEWVFPRRKLNPAFQHPIIQLAYVLSGTNSTTFIDRFTRPNVNSTGVSLVNVTDFMRSVDVSSLPLGITIWNLLLAILNLPLTPSFSRHIPSENLEEVVAIHPPDTSLFGQTILSNLTASPSFNKTFVYTLEGWSIVITTISVFVLLFLIREWVVQQQPVADAQGHFDEELLRLGNQPRPQAPIERPEPLGSGQTPGLDDEESSPVLPEDVQANREAGIPPSPTAEIDRSSSATPGPSMAEEDPVDGENSSLPLSRHEEEAHQRFNSDRQSGSFEQVDEIGAAAKAMGSVGDEAPWSPDPSYWTATTANPMGWKYKPPKLVDAPTSTQERAKLHLAQLKMMITIESRYHVRNQIADALDRLCHPSSRSEEERRLLLSKILRAAEILHTNERTHLSASGQSLYDAAAQTLARWEHEDQDDSFEQAIQQAGLSMEPSSGSPLLTEEGLPSKFPSSSELPSSWTPSDSAGSPTPSEPPALSVTEPRGTIRGETDVSVNDEPPRDSLDALPPSGERTDQRIDIWEWLLLIIYGDITVPDGGLVPAGDLEVRLLPGEEINSDEAPVPNEPPLPPPVAAVPPNAAAQNQQAIIPAPELPPNGDADENGLGDDDVEGILEMLGLRGPLRNLLQNSVLACFLITVGLTFCVWMPYLWGKIFLLLVAKPLTIIQMPVYLYTSFSRLVNGLVLGLLRTAQWLIPSIRDAALEANPYVGTKYLWIKHFIARGVANNQHLDHQTSFMLAEVKEAFVPTYEALRLQATTTTGHVTSAFPILRTLMMEVVPKLPRLFTSIDIVSSTWTGWEKVAAIVAGYAGFSLLGAIYLKVGPLSENRRETEKALRDFLSQAGGILKVIVIIGIEMMFFPLYCGLLLGFALLPLFADTTVQTRIAFMQENPYTSTFVHWFIGTSYMFHFALFIAMCRGIFRPGVLYFVRDPDDPTFHPVRDVLERPVITQLWRLANSAVLYGGLIICCVGSVVWSLDFLVPGLLPFRWTSDQPILEFPLDVLFYNFCFPLILRSIRPSLWLKVAYTKWFRFCARHLRLSHFLFNIHRKVEGGSELQEEAKEESSVEAEVAAVGGRYVRAPNSDRVRIPKGQDAFLPVDSEDRPLDGRGDTIDRISVHARRANLFVKLYVPPFFRIRIALLVITTWLFTALAAAVVTVCPLLIGRFVFGLLLPASVVMNDVFAMTIGVSLIGFFYNVLMFALHIRKRRRANASGNASKNQPTLSAWTYVEKILRLLYAYGTVFTIGPLISSAVLNLYLLIPLQTYFSPSKDPILNITQNFTVGLLLTLVIIRVFTNITDTRPGLAFRRVIAHGYLNPDIKTLTRCFLLPAIFLSTFDIGLPLLAGRTFINQYTSILGKDLSAHQCALIYRYSYPAMLIGIGLWECLATATGALKAWRRKIRDEAYLLGERLNNLEESVPRTEVPAKSEDKGKGKAVDVYVYVEPQQSTEPSVWPENNQGSAQDTKWPGGIWDDDISWEADDEVEARYADTGEVNKVGDYCRG